MFGRLAAAAGAAMAGFIVAAVASEGDDKFIIGAILAVVFMLAFAGAELYTSGTKAADVESGVQIGGNVGDSNYIAGRDQHIQVGSPIQSVLPEQWWLEENAPRFDVRPNVQNGIGKEPNRLAVTFEQEGADVVAEARWLGEGLTGNWADLTRENPRTSRKFTVRAHTPFEPKSESGKVKFEIRTHWRGAYSYSQWEWPYHIVHKFDWPNLVLDTTRENLAPVRRWRVLD